MSLFRRMQIQGQKIQMPRFINTELKLDSESSHSDSEKMEAKIDDELKSGSDSEEDILLIRFCLCLYF